MYVIEKDPPENQDPLEWILYTSLEVKSFEDAIIIIKYYKHRWIIEEYHKCIKTGCKVEEKQLKQNFRLKNFLGIANIVALNILLLRDFARLHPNIYAKEIIESLKVDILMKYFKINDKNPTMEKYVKTLAQLGGFIGRKSDGLPGWQTLWTGEQMLLAMLAGAKLVLMNKTYG